MDCTAGYCRTRKDLEERCWVLTSRHATLTARLLASIGGDHDTYLTALDRCHTAHLEITVSRNALRSHRCDHGC